MSEKKIDMFKLVEQVEKQKKMDIDDIFSNLDSVKNEEISVSTKTPPPYPIDTNAKYFFDMFARPVARPNLTPKIKTADNIPSCHKILIASIKTPTIFH